MLENLRERIENLIVWKTRFKTCFFDKHFISYSCILFIKFNALRSFCTKLVFFFNLFFPKFRSIKPIFRSIEIAIKNFGQPLSVSIDAQLILVQSKHFRLFEPNFRSIENRIKNFSNLLFTCSILLFKKFSKLSLSTRLGQGFNQIFLSFSSILFARFFSPKAGKTFIAFLLHLFTCFMH